MGGGDPTQPEQKERSTTPPMVKLASVNLKIRITGAEVETKPGAGKT